MIVLDTNVVSEPMRVRPSALVLGWLERHPGAVITSISVGELFDGARRLPHGRRRDSLISKVSAIVESQQGRILGFDERAAAAYAAMREARRVAGRPLGVEDGMIAAVAATAGANLATRNVADFEGLGLELVNPWDS